MFYRPLPERRPSPLRLLRVLPGEARAADLTSLLLAGLVTVALGAPVPVATGRRARRARCRRHRPG
ncbi:NHLP bacteriocin export ABC transporter permease/ATPase subunit OS=Streptomyces tendae OX=1932 GN=F3L20_16760 PE=4 SV=1 [Streptomyces tendae]